MINIDGTLTGAPTPGDSNGYEEVTPYVPKLQKRTLITGCGLRSYQDIPLLGKKSYPIFVSASHQTGCKVNDPKVDYSGALEEEKVGHEPRLEHC